MVLPKALLCSLNFLTEYLFWISSFL